MGVYRHITTLNFFQDDSLLETHPVQPFLPAIFSPYVDLLPRFRLLQVVIVTPSPVQCHFARDSYRVMQIVGCIYAVQNSIKYIIYKRFSTRSNKLYYLA